MTPIAFAHRGARAQFADNTLPGFRYALEHGATGLETDAWLSGDGEVVLVHDEVIRPGAMGRLRRGVTVGSTPAERLAELGVPSLARLYAELGTDFELSVDLKTPAVDQAIVDVARRAGDPARLWLCTPSVERLDAIRALGSDARLVHSTRRARLPQSLERHAADLAEHGIDALNLHHSEWTAGLVALFHRFDVRAFAWDVQEIRHLRAVVNMGIDALYSDHVDRMMAVVRGE